MNYKNYILPIIVFSQFCCTSLWFAGNGVLTDLIRTFDLNLNALGHLTSAVQFGFILGTLAFAFLSVADRFSPSKVFFASALLGAGFNLGIVLEENSLSTILLLRFLTGFCLAGIYPVGMKIAADYFEKGLGKSLGYLVGALVLGTAFPHLLKTLTGTNELPWKLVILSTSLLALLGGFLVLVLVPDGPYRRGKNEKDLSAFLKVFKVSAFRRAAFGYFGHMWELYAFWAFAPVLLLTYQTLHPEANFNIPLLSFFIIATGGVGCVAAGYLSQRLGTQQTATTALLLSGLCCLLSPLVFLYASPFILITFLIFWGFMVVADSPLFSSLVAKNSPAESRGTALTIVNCIGFAITIISLQLLNLLLGSTLNPVFLLSVLVIGPVLGLWALLKK